MGPKSKKMDNVETSTTEAVKAKRGRKSKKELMAALNMESLIKEKDTKKSVQNTINLSVSEIENTSTHDISNKNNVYEEVLNDNDTNLEEGNNEFNNIIITSTTTTTVDEPKIAKKRGRKPKDYVEKVQMDEEQIAEAIILNESVNQPKKEKDPYSDLD